MRRTKSPSGREVVKVGRCSIPGKRSVFRALRARYKCELGHADFKVVAREVEDLDAAFSAEEAWHQRYPVPGRVHDARGNTPSRPHMRRHFVYRIVGRPQDRERLHANARCSDCGTRFAPKWGHTRKPGRPRTRCPGCRARKA